MKTFYFTDKVTEEDFLVEESSLSAAMEVAKEHFEEPSFIEEISEEEAEWLGIDTY